MPGTTIIPVGNASCLGITWEDWACEKIDEFELFDALTIKVRAVFDNPDIIASLLCSGISVLYCIVASVGISMV